MSSPDMAAPDWQRLRARLAGPLHLPRDPSYGTARQGFLTLHDGQRPAAVAQCASVDDVQACVRFAASTRTPIAARSGGHSYAGYSTRDGSLVVDVRGLAGVHVTGDGTATIGAGAQLIDIYTALAGHGRTLPGGTCPSVGIAGLTLGGGIGVTARKYGLTCDRLVAADIVTADGALRTVSATAEPDLFWALRGGGGGNFGIVTSLTFDTVPATDLTVFDLTFPGAALPAVLDAWQSWVVPDEIWSHLDTTGDPDAPIRVAGCFIGDEPEVRPYLTDLVKLTDEQPLTRNSTQFGHLEAMRHFAGQFERSSYVSTSRMIGTAVRDTSAMADLLRSSPGVHAQFDSFGGAIARLGTGDTAFPHRDIVASMQIVHDVDGNETEARQAIGHIRDEVGRTFGETGYVNYIDPEMPNWAHAYYGVNLPRLRDVADRYDPRRVFAFPQGLG